MGSRAPSYRFVRRYLERHAPGHTAAVTALLASRPREPGGGGLHRVDTPKKAGREELAGVGERGMRTSGLLRNLGDLVVSVRKSREGQPG